MSQYNLFRRKPLQYAKISDVSCTGCGWCAKFCPMECIKMRPDGFYTVNEAHCIGCGKCKKNCFWDAVEIIKRPREEAEL